MALNRLTAIGGILALSACATPPKIAYENLALVDVTESELRKFESAEAFNAYLDRVQQIELEAAVTGLAKNRYAQLFSPTPTVSDECVEEDCETIIVTGSRAAPNPTITNNQKAGVDEGDIVKQIGDFLIVLQDGRLYSILIGEGENGDLDYVDRANVYRDPDVHTWYDELLVSGRRVIVTGYSYDADASEIALFTLDEKGKFILEDTFYISSDDYYSTENYATRVVNGKFIFHTPIYIAGYEADDALPWPLLRHWGGSFYPNQYDSWSELPTNQLLTPEDIYRPVQPTTSPLVHVVTVCDIVGHRMGESLECRSSGFTAPEGYQYYVSENDVFLWTWPDDDDWEFDAPTSDYCEHRGRVARREALPAVIYKIPINGDAPSILKATGRPFDQFSIDTRGYHLRALVDWMDPRCVEETETVHPTLFQGSLNHFSKALSRRQYGSYYSLPSYSYEFELQNRFTENHLIYSLDDWGRYPPDENEYALAGSVMVTPVRRPHASQKLDLSHNIARLELVGDNAIATGYDDNKGLHFSYLKTAGTPRIASAIVLPTRYESEGRSHAFNYLLNEEGNAILGLPTVFNSNESGRWWWESDSSDVSYLKLVDEQLSDLGALTADEDALDDDYECEISCIDWYGNTRPIFTEGRIFALSGVELIEGVIEGERIAERRRLNLSTPLSMQTID